MVYPYLKCNIGLPGIWQAFFCFEMIRLAIQSKGRLNEESDGPACHRGTESCFDIAPEQGFLGKLAKVVRKRHKEMPQGHYTTRLFSEGVAKISQKVGEEAVETILEAMRGDRGRYIYEAYDLLYHLLVLNEQMGIGLEDLEKELLSRHK